MLLDKENKSGGFERVLGAHCTTTKAGRVLRKSSCGREVVGSEKPQTAHLKEENVGNSKPRGCSDGASKSSWAEPALPEFGMWRSTGARLQSLHGWAAKMLTWQVLSPHSM